MFCSNCGTQLSEGLNFCTNCGTRLVKTTAAEGNAAVQQPIQTAPVQAEPAQTTERVQPSEPAQNPAAAQNNAQSYFAGQAQASNMAYANQVADPYGFDELLCAYITGSAAPNQYETHYLYYKQAFTKISMTGSKTSWNWGAFWFSGFNLMWRKSYGKGIGLLALCIVISFIPFLGSLIALFIPPIFANSLHYDRYNQILAEAKSLFPVDTMKQRMHLAQRGGVDKRILIVWIAASVIAVIIFTLLIIPALLSLV